MSLRAPEFSLFSRYHTRFLSSGCYPGLLTRFSGIRGIFKRLKSEHDTPLFCFFSDSLFSEWRGLMHIPTLNCIVHWTEPPLVLNVPCSLLPVGIPHKGPSGYLISLKLYSSLLSTSTWQAPSYPSELSLDIIVQKISLDLLRLAKGSFIRQLWCPILPHHSSFYTVL